MPTDVALIDSSVGAESAQRKIHSFLQGIDFSDICFQVFDDLKSFSDISWGTSFLLKSKKASIGEVKVDF